MEKPEECFQTKYCHDYLMDKDSFHIKLDQFSKIETVADHVDEEMLEIKQEW